MFGETLNCCLKVLCFAGWGEGWERSPLCGLPWRVSDCAGKPLNFRIQKTFLCDGSVSAAKMPPASAFGDYKPGCPCSRGRRGRGREDTHLSCVETVTQSCYQTCTLSLAGILLLGAGSGWGGGVSKEKDSLEVLMRQDSATESRPVSGEKASSLGQVSEGTWGTTALHADYSSIISGLIQLVPPEAPGLIQA